jgi:hypothetical protein
MVFFALLIIILVVLAVFIWRQSKAKGRWGIRPVGRISR